MPLKLGRTSKVWDDLFKKRKSSVGFQYPLVLEPAIAQYEWSWCETDSGGCAESRRESARIPILRLHSSLTSLKQYQHSQAL